MYGNLCLRECCGGACIAHHNSICICLLSCKDRATTRQLSWLDVVCNKIFTLFYDGHQKRSTPAGNTAFTLVS